MLDKPKGSRHFLRAEKRLLDSGSGSNITISYDQTICPYHTKIAELVVRNTPSSNDQRSLRILDYGCGVGNTLHEIERLAPSKFSFVVHDIDPACVSKCKNVTGVSEALDAQGFENLKTEESSFDVILASHVLHYDFDFAATLQTFKRLAKPNAVLVITVPNAVTPAIIANSLRRKSYGTGPVVSWDWSSFENLLTNLNFDEFSIHTDYVPLPLFNRLPGGKSLETALVSIFPNFGFSLIGVCKTVE